MQRVLITGAAGFLGSHLADRFLTEGYEVVGVDNFDPFYDREIKEANVADLADDGGQFGLVEADIRDGDAMAAVMADARPDVIFHIAALAGVRPSVLDPRRYASVNVDGLVDLLRWDCSDNPEDRSASPREFRNNLIQRVSPELAWV